MPAVIVDVHSHVVNAGGATADAFTGQNRQRFVAFHGPPGTPEWLQREP